MKYKSSSKSLICSILAKDTVQDCKIVFINEVMALEKPQVLATTVIVIEENALEHSTTNNLSILEKISFDNDQ